MESSVFVTILVGLMGCVCAEESYSCSVNPNDECVFADGVTECKFMDNWVRDDYYWCDTKSGSWEKCKVCEDDKSTSAQVATEAATTTPVSTTTLASTTSTTTTPGTTSAAAMTTTPGTSSTTTTTTTPGTSSTTTTTPETSSATTPGSGQTTTTTTPGTSSTTTTTTMPGTSSTTTTTSPGTSSATTPGSSRTTTTTTPGTSSTTTTMTTAPRTSRTTMTTTPGISPTTTSTATPSASAYRCSVDPDDECVFADGVTECKFQDNLIRDDYYWCYVKSGSWKKCKVCGGSNSTVEDNIPVYKCSMNPNVACTFPFENKGKTYNKCTTDDPSTGKPWCGTNDRRTTWVLCKICEEPEASKRLITPSMKVTVTPARKDYSTIVTNAVSDPELFNLLTTTTKQTLPTVIADGSDEKQTVDLGKTSEIIPTTDFHVTRSKSTAAPLRTQSKKPTNKWTDLSEDVTTPKPTVLKSTSTPLGLTAPDRRIQEAVKQTPSIESIEATSTSQSVGARPILAAKTVHSKVSIPRPSKMTVPLVEDGPVATTSKVTTSPIMKTHHPIIEDRSIPITAEATESVLTTDVHSTVRSTTKSSIPVVRDASDPNISGKITGPQSSMWPYLSSQNKKAPVPQSTGKPDPKPTTESTTLRTKGMADVLSLSSTPIPKAQTEAAVTSKSFDALSSRHVTWPAKPVTPLSEYSLPKLSTTEPQTLSVIPATSPSKSSNAKTSTTRPSTSMPAPTTRKSRLLPSTTAPLLSKSSSPPTQPSTTSPTPAPRTRKSRLGTSRTNNPMTSSAKPVPPIHKTSSPRSTTTRTVTSPSNPKTSPSPLATSSDMPNDPPIKDISATTKSKITPVAPRKKPLSDPKSATSSTKPTTTRSSTTPKSKQMTSSSTKSTTTGKSSSTTKKTPTTKNPPTAKKTSTTTAPKSVGPRGRLPGKEKNPGPSQETEDKKPDLSDEGQDPSLGNKDKSTQEGSEDSTDDNAGKKSNIVMPVVLVLCIMAAIIGVVVIVVFVRRRRNKPSSRGVEDGGSGDSLLKQNGNGSSKSVSPDGSQEMQPLTSKSELASSGDQVVLLGGKDSRSEGEMLS